MAGKGSTKGGEEGYAEKEVQGRVVWVRNLRRAGRGEGGTRVEDGGKTRGKEEGRGWKAEKRGKR